MKNRAFSIGITIIVATLLLLLFAGTIAAEGACILEIIKHDPEGNALAGATFLIEPDPTSEPPGTGQLTVTDNGPNDSDPADGVIRVNRCNCNPDITYTITETVAPQGYTPAPPQTTKIFPVSPEEPVVLTFVNEPPVVGGEAFPVATSDTYLPWIPLGVVIAGGLVFFIVKKHRPVSE